MTSEPPPRARDAGADGHERRLHPMSWLFVMVQQLRTFLLPLLAFVLFGRSDRNELWSAVVICVLAAVSIWRYLTYSYRIDTDSVLIRSGLLHRTLRQIPFSRIHNVALHQTLLHRMFGVAEVRLESAGGHEPEAEMRVLRLDDANALEALVRRHALAPVAASTVAAAPQADAGRADDDRPLLAMPRGDVLRLGVISNRGMIVFGAALVAVSQLRPQLAPDAEKRWGLALDGFFGHLGLLDTLLVFAAVIAGFVALLRVLSMALALLQYSGFRLELHGRRLTAERGLLTRMRTSVSRRRLQAFVLEEGVLHRLFARRSLKVDTAVAHSRRDDRTFRELAPLATAAACDTLVQRLLPRIAWPPTRWHPLHARAWWRLALPGAVLAAVATALACWQFGSAGAWTALALAPVAWAARRRAARAGYAIDGALVALREGWWTRRWRFTELDKLQVLQVRRSPLDRLLGMASLSLDTAGADPRASALRIRFLPEHEARALLAALSMRVAATPLRW